MALQQDDTRPVEMEVFFNEHADGYEEHMAEHSENAHIMELIEHQIPQSSRLLTKGSQRRRRFP